MERATCREQVLLGHGARKLLGNPASSPKLPLRNSDVDFSDVFGGPPRCPITEMRHILGETVDSSTFRGGEDTPPLRNSWSNFSEKPVFGGDSPSRRRQPGGDFFDDIFRIEDSVTTTPRKHDRDPWSSTPGSRALSPARPVLPKFEQFGGGSSLPAQIGLPPKPTKGMDHSTFSTPCRSPVQNREAASSTFAFPSSPGIGLIKVASETKLGQDYPRYDSRAFYRQSSLSREFPIASNGSLKDSESARQETGPQFAKYCSSSKVSSDNNQFHFSIYKWASKGVTLMMPSKGDKGTKSKERGKNESIVSGLPAPVLQGVNLSSLDETTSKLNTSFHFQYDIQDVSPSQDLSILMKGDIVEEPMLSTPESKKPLHNSISGITKEPGRSSKLHPNTSRSSPTGLCKPTDKEEYQPKVNLDCALNDSSDEPGKEMVRPAREEIGMPKVSVSLAGNVDGSIKVKKLTGKKIILNHAQATAPSSQVELLNSEHKVPENRIKGKVKEYVKIFNQEASPKLACHVEAQYRSSNSKRKDLGAFKVDDLTSFYTTKADAKETVSNGQSGKILTDVPVMADQILKQTRVVHIDVNINNQNIHESGNSISGSCSETTQEGFKKAFGNIHESHGEDLQVNFLIEQSPEELQKQQQTDLDQDQIQISDGKIQKWSQGKEGNIRALLSTLHSVLWPNSGWKAVPLVDIIEGNSVKKAYQKALLCLHPDKLQQKGALIHHKYIAEKVLDILQQAWDHFNSLSAI